MSSKLKFNVIGTRTVNDVEPGGVLELSQSEIGPGYVGGDKKKGEAAINVAALLLSGYVEPANAETQKWVHELGSGFEHFAPKAKAEEKKGTDA
jgi:hypothetical protein